jgi:YfiH family protein
MNIITHPLLDEISHIRYGFFGRQGGVSAGVYESLNCGLGSNDKPENVEKNRQFISEAMQVQAIYNCHQIHSNKVITVNSVNQQKQEADSVLTETKNVTIGVLTADCGCLLIADREKPIIAAVHAGWKGALSGIIQNTIEEMLIKGATQKTLCAVLGPTISQDNYEVDSDFKHKFTDRGQSYELFFKPSTKAEHFMFNLPAYILTQLKLYDIDSAWVGYCTYANEDLYFSYRRATHRLENDYGRQLSVIALQ